MKERLYFSWEGGPAVIEPVPEGELGFFHRDDAWVLASPRQVFDFFVDGIELSEAEFKEKFGTIGGILPNLPSE